MHRKIKGHPMLHEYLQFLETVGMSGVPHFIGLDKQGREILTFLPGKTMGPDYPSYHPDLHADDTIVDMAKLMRKLHDISAGFVPKAIENNWANPYFPHGNHEIICHGDAAIWNFVFADGKVAGLFDFDQAYPGTRAWDLATTVFSVVGLVEYFHDLELKITVKYDALKHAAERKRQIKLFFDAYDMECPRNFIDLCIQFTQMAVCDKMIEGAAAGDKNHIRCIKEGHLRHYQNVIAHLKKHGHEWI